MFALFRRALVSLESPLQSTFARRKPNQLYSTAVAEADDTVSKKFVAALAAAVETKLADKKIEAQRRMEAHQIKRSVEQRYNGAVKRRKWQDPPADPEAVKNFDPASRVKRRKSVILLGYSGVDYFGMQRNPGTRTIEEDLLRAMLKQNWINDEGFRQPQQIQFQRAARTDKGVSAAVQVVSIKLPDNLDINALNSELPPAIRVYAVKRVTKGFNSKTNCDARTYTYTLPTIAFAPEDEKGLEILTYRLPAERLQRVNEVLALYVGTKNFHNFTSRKEFIDPSVKRFIMQFECEAPFVPNGTTSEFATIRIKGQSFMLHQIRKMVGLTLAVVRGLSGADTIERAFGQERYGIPTAPGLGLVLSRIHYDKYNKRYGEDGCHEMLDFEKEEPLIQEFFKRHIASTIVETELQTGSMLEWLEKLPLHSYEPRDENEPGEWKKRKPNDDDDGDE
ncbi:pseudouridylate synthase 1 homolog [Anopheles bellator]|uniref:pseudouridylate synthase 1 homolog n=1 Tax=Anopheles bellator TaxID=139047 RepID=UPI002649BB03|nr:pseudouridylate synthase 1 homolog [Anopheles bellator]